MPLPLSRLVSGSAAFVTALAVAACFSERQTATGPGPTTGECRIPVNSSLIGIPQALVAMRNFSFGPDTVRVPRGTTVTWISCEPEGTEAHTSTSTENRWSSPFLAPGESYSRTFPEAGRFSYFCEPHPFMQGVVVVE